MSVALASTIDSCKTGKSFAAPFVGLRDFGCDETGIINRHEDSIVVHVLETNLATANSRIDLL